MFDLDHQSGLFWMQQPTNAPTGKLEFSLRLFNLYLCASALHFYCNCHTQIRQKNVSSEITLLSTHRVDPLQYQEPSHPWSTAQCRCSWRPHKIILHALPAPPTGLQALERSECISLQQKNRNRNLLSLLWYI